MKKLKEEIENIFDDNENYWSGYTGTPMLQRDIVIPKIMDVVEKMIRRRKPQIQSKRK